jgi:hypothetical protein
VRRVLLALSMQEGWGNVGWASDWGKNIYAPSAFLGAQGSEPKTFNVRTQFTAPDGNEVDKTWKVGVFITQARRLAHALRLRRTGGGGDMDGASDRGQNIYISTAFLGTEPETYSVRT